MSHIVSINSRITDANAVASACRRLNLAAPVTGTAQLYSGEVTGLLVQLPGWTYPAVIDTASGDVKYDNFEGNWGEQVEMSRFLQMYAVEKARLEARARGHTVSEQTLQDGSIRLQIHQGG